MNTKNIGDVGEAIVLAETVKKGLNISKPFGDNAKYDFIIEEPDGYLSKIQVKTSTRNNGEVIRFDISSSYIIRGEYTKLSYTKEDIDYFLLVNLENNEIYKFEPNGSKEIVIRLQPSRQKKNVNFARELLW